MNTREHRWISGILVGILTAMLWQFTLWLLGLKQRFPRGIAGFVGSVIVLVGCFSIARHVASFWKLKDVSKKERDLYTEVQAEIEAERQIKKDAEPAGCTKPRAKTSQLQAQQHRRGVGEPDCR